MTEYSTDFMMMIALIVVLSTVVGFICAVTLTSYIVESIFFEIEVLADEDDDENLNREDLS